MGDATLSQGYNTVNQNIEGGKDLKKKKKKNEGQM
jgi:hypothetical protein